MSYTNVDLVRSHLAESRSVRETITDQPISLGESGTVRFYSGPVVAGSVRVKSIRGGTPVRRSVTLTGGSAILGAVPVVPGSVVAASDSSLGTIYEENVDFVVDYAAALLSAKGGGSLTGSESLTVWLNEYVVCIEGVDYAVHADTGEMSRLAGGDIAPTECLLIDYTPVYNAHDDLLIASAANEANGLVAGEIDPDCEFGADPVLQSAATCVALAIVCRAAAARALTANPGDDRAAVAWLKIAETYAGRGDSLLRRFHPPHRGPAAPSTT